MLLLRDSPRRVSLTGLSNTVRTCTFLSVGMAGGTAHNVGNNEDPGMRYFGRWRYIVMNVDKCFMKSSIVLGW